MKHTVIISALLLLLSNNALATEIKDSLQLQEVVVTGSRNAVDIRHLPMVVNIVNRNDLTKQHRGNILPTVMQQVPSLFVTGRSMMGYGVATGGSGGINLRGLSGGVGQFLVLIDGQPQYNGIFGHPISDTYQTQMTERVEILRGPASVLYGSNAMGGVMNIVTRTMQQDGTKTSVDVSVGSHNSIQAEASTQMRKGKLSASLSAQYNHSDNHRPRMDFEQIAGFAKVGYQFNDIWNTTANINISHFSASHPGSTDSPLYNADQWITRGVTSLAINNKYNSTSGSISIYCNFGRHKLDDGTPDPTKPTERFFRSKDALTGISLYQSFNLFTGSRLTAGFDYQHIYGNAFYVSKENGSILATNNKQSGKSIRHETAIYIDFRHNLGQWLTYDMGLRLDHHSVTGSEWIPQIGVVVRPTNNGEIKAMISKGFRNPTMKEMYLYPPSNEELKPERIINYELSWKHRFSKVSYATNIYLINGDNMIQTIERKNINTGKIKNIGIELETTYHISETWHLNANFSFLHMEYPVIAAPTYKGYVGANFNKGRWTASANMQFIGDLYTAIGKEEYLETFCLVDAYIGFKLSDNIVMWTRAENLLAQEYEINFGYPMPKTTAMIGLSINI